jgi:hypothetical protein
MRTLTWLLMLAIAAGAVLCACAHLKTDAEICAGVTVPEVAGKEADSLLTAADNAIQMGVSPSSAAWKGMAAQAVGGVVEYAVCLAEHLLADYAADKVAGGWHHRSHRFKHRSVELRHLDYLKALAGASS